jgi:hypothetical protein
VPPTRTPALRTVPRVLVPADELAEEPILEAVDLEAGIAQAGDLNGPPAC